ncbi:MAG: ABC-F family ATP-binding cassette domain-containing protein [Selenomonas sp.]|uniref:ABC-F family ATP-binding cassette domain-containing protein n=1 Tax=Selenomonas sp. TaxID=2053611 RepID=UPI0025D79749|nr:ABC-F family ATP-binding cassette domain-containing protein [Selenomonas sp.]MCI6100174.1 ABC-F family ATP-binding cassette domain-containing protein [Selenomonas sp.]MCI6232845.1 ABC-F family ATP-binding cassette domain-containing protein [Selenomonas sp.]
MLLTLENFTKSYGEKTLFAGVDFSIDDGERVGIVGVNGTGKSTFLKAVAGLTPVDDGTRIERRGLRVEMLAQDKVFASENTVLMEVFRGTSPLMQALRDYELALRAAEERPDDAKVQQALAKCSAAIDAAGGWQLESEAKTVLTQLGITDFAAPVGTLSGGEQKRLALATALVQPCDLLLLDEPTNHLDSETIAWLETYLSGRKGALLMVTHDRYFLDRTATKILELDKGHAYTYTGNYSDFLEQKAARIEREQASEAKRQNFLRNELKWLRRGAQARSTKQKARIERYEEVKAQTPDLDRSTVEIGLAGSRLGRTVIELDHVHYEVDGQTIVKDFSYTVLRHDRMAILGRNGTGKTTLLDIIAGRLAPTSGTVKIGQTVKIGYFTQKAVEMDERLRAIEYIEEAAHTITLADGQAISASQLMERFLFPGALQWTLIARLSGGEKRRLYLLRILMEAPNVLLLDEPTNDLDLETMAVLESFIDDFNGAIILVSHDRFFVDRLADKCFVYEPGGELRMYPGGYSYYKEKEAEEQAEAAAAEAQRPVARKAATVAESSAEAAPAAKGADEKAARPKKLTFKEQKEYAEIEDIIASKEGELKATELLMQQNASDYGKLADLTKDQQRLQAELDHLMERWAYLEEVAESST